MQWRKEPTWTTEVELSVTPIDLRLEELQRHEAIKMHRDPVSYLNYKMNKKTKSSSRQSPCKHLQSTLKQLLKELAHQKNCTDLEALKLPPVNPPTLFHKGIKENEIADELAKVATKKAKTLEPTYNITIWDIKTKNSKLTHKDRTIHPTIYIKT